jgi:hypothetical protein
MWNGDNVMLGVVPLQQSPGSGSVATVAPSTYTMPPVTVATVE